MDTTTARPADQLAAPAACIVHMGAGERIPAELAAALRPIAPGTLHVYCLSAHTDVELHYHTGDEYWAFISGTPEVTLRTPNGETHTETLGPGDLVACLRGVEHTLHANHDVVYYQYSSVLQPGETMAHQIR
jgi:mannose-6-phosphate isomerase-like protein (cupin superfamily)